MIRRASRATAGSTALTASRNACKPVIIRYCWREKEGVCVVYIERYVLEWHMCSVAQNLKTCMKGIGCVERWVVHTRTYPAVDQKSPHNTAVGSHSRYPSTSGNFRYFCYSPVRSAVVPYPFGASFVSSFVPVQQNLRIFVVPVVLTMRIHYCVVDQRMLMARVGRENHRDVA